jgi:hypothetical protein
MIDPEKARRGDLRAEHVGHHSQGEGEDADWRILRGKYRRSVRATTFFITVGRPDLARRSPLAMRSTRMMVVGGSPRSIVGVFVVGPRFEGRLGSALAWAGVGRRRSSPYWVSDVFEGPDSERRRGRGLVRRYNERLRSAPGTDRGKRIHVCVLIAPACALDRPGRAASRLPRDSDPSGA